MLDNRAERIKLYKEIRDILDVLISAESEVVTKLSNLSPGEVFYSDVGSFIVLNHTTNTTLVASNGLYWDKDKKEFPTICYDDKTCIASLSHTFIMDLCNQIYKEQLKNVFDNKIFNHKKPLDFNGREYREWYIRPMTEDEWDKYNYIFNYTTINECFWLLNACNDLKNAYYVDIDRTIKYDRQKKEKGLIFVFEISNDIEIKKRLFGNLQHWSMINA